MVRDLLVASALGDEREDFRLARREAIFAARPVAAVVVARRRGALCPARSCVDGLDGGDEIGCGQGFRDVSVRSADSICASSRSQV